MRDIPMLFSSAMVLALLAGRKRQTRRLKFSGAVGDLIWVKETWAVSRHWDDTRPVAGDGRPGLLKRGMTMFYDCGGSSANVEVPDTLGIPAIVWQADDWPRAGEQPDWVGKRRVSIHMPKWASRLTLKVTAVRREPLHWISDEDGQAEGLDYMRAGDTGLWGIQGVGWHKHPRFGYELLWRRLHGDESWDSNPDVWVVDFEVLKHNVEDVRHALESA